MDPEYVAILKHLVIALGMGGLIGFERSYHGRPAGFRTHALVCVASSALMLLAMYQDQWYPAAFAGRVTLDPTRMAQGIMTGVGFLGAGVIFKEGLSVRGLTTAASIWMTATVGILAGAGFYFPMIAATVITLGTLTVFRWIEVKVPGEFFAHLEVRCPRDGGMDEAAVRNLLGEYGFSVANVSFAATAEPRVFEFQMVVRAPHHNRAVALAEALRRSSQISEFRMTPTTD
jgi:putative Mg2+ transporter-C (MgtC) family protein